VDDRRRARVRRLVSLHAAITLAGMAHPVSAGIAESAVDACMCRSAMALPRTFGHALSPANGAPADDAHARAQWHSPDATCGRDESGSRRDPNGEFRIRLA